jgi:hypothetical protein
VDTHTLVTIGGVWALCAVMAGISAGEKGRRFWVWFFFGVLTGPFALYRVIRAPEVIPPELAQTCPNCQKAIRKTLRICPRCGHSLRRDPDPVMQASRQAAAAYVLLRRAARKSSAVVKAEQAKRKSAPTAKPPAAS